MIKKRKRNGYILIQLAGMLCILLACTLLFSQNAMAATQYKNSGKCGSHATWKVNKKTKTLTISGKGAITKRIPLRQTDGEGETLEGYSYVEKIVIKEGITAIEGNRPFIYVGATKSIKLPRSLKRIGETGLAEISSLKEIIIPRNVEKIGEGVFFRCRSLKKITVDSENSHFCSVNGVLLSKNKKTLVAYPGGKSSSDGEYTVPATVKNIKGLAFAYNYKLKKVILPKGLKKLGGGSFYCCGKLEEVNLQDTQIKEVTDYDGRKMRLASSWIYYRKTDGDQGWFMEDAIYPEEYCWLGTFLYTSLKSLSLPDTLEKISTLSLIETDLQSLRLGKGFSGSIGVNPDKDISVYRDVLSLDIMESVQYLEVDSENQTYMSKDNVIYSKDGSTVYGSPSGNSVLHITLRENAKQILPYAFYNNWHVRSVTSNHSLIRVGEYAFAESSVNLIVTGDVGYIEPYAFSQGSINRFFVTGNIYFLGENAFYKCLQLKDFEIGGDVYEMHQHALAGSAVVDMPPSTLLSQQKNLLDDSSGTCGPNAAWNIDFENSRIIIRGEGEITEKIRLIRGVAMSVKHIQIEEGITGIKNRPFEELVFVETVSLPDSLVEIASFSFAGFEPMKTVTIPKNVTSIGDGVFYGCTNLKKIKVSKKNKKYISLDGVLFTKNKKKIITFPVAGEGMEKYSNGSSYTVIVPKEVREIAPLAFAGVKYKKYFILPKRLKKIGGGAFYGSRLDSINLQDTQVSKLPDYNGWEIQMPNPVYIEKTDLSREEYYYWGTFEGTEIEELELPAKVKRISTRCLLDTKLTTLTLGKKYKEMGVGDFPAANLENDADLAGVYHNYLMSSAFSSLKKIQISPLNKNFTIEGGVIYDKTGTTVYGINEMHKDLITLKDTVTTIAPYAFYKNKCLQRVIVTGNLNVIATAAFMDSGLWEFKMNGAVNVIGDSAFQNTKITTFINDGVTQIGYSAFKRSYLTTVVFGGNVSVMGEAAFANCYILKDVSFSGTAVVPGNAFHNCFSLLNSSLSVTTDVASMGGISKSA